MLIRLGIAENNDQPIDINDYYLHQIVAVADAPAEIPLWYFDETLGYWKEDGTAIRILEGSDDVILEDGQSIRLDLLISVNGKELKTYC